MTQTHSHFFTGHRETVLRLGFGAFLISTILVHTVVPKALVWWAAFGLLVAMTVPYLTEAMATKTARLAEAVVAVGLAGLALLGPLVSPGFVIAAIFLHGVWDLAKHRQIGVPFLSWYCWSCAAFDFAYAGLLCLVWLG